MVGDIEVGTQAEGFENKVLRRIFGPRRDEVRVVEKTTQRGA
jgi:hypothetical protein